MYNITMKKLNISTQKTSSNEENFPRKNRSKNLKNEKFKKKLRFLKKTCQTLL